uniref:peptidylamidoglycolate lyase n=1 Tax=Glossina morsitans morsitans TaxID=37546 RepID=A0A1B0GDJ1_GLOMM
MVLLTKLFRLWWWLIISVVCVIESATDETLSFQHYFPLVTEDQFLSNDKRFQQIMQGATSADINWPDKIRSEKIDVKEEIYKLASTYVYQSSWPDLTRKLGSVTAVDFDKDGHVVLFHRADHVWTQATFDHSNVYRDREKGPICNSTVLALDCQTGKLVYEWGKNLFYMPHGLSIDQEDNVWVTDVALHQVFKFGPRGFQKEPLMTLGKAFSPGATDTKFCKPTAVAVLESGDFFVADGYCNARIVKFSKKGEKILSWGQNSFAGSSYDVAPPNYFAIPHALALVPDRELICTADRENGRIQCFFWSNGTFHSQYHSLLMGDRLFSLAYTPIQGGQLLVVNGPSAELGTHPEHYNEVRGYVLDFKSKKILSKFGPNDLQFSNPHDLAVTNNGLEVYVAELNPMRLHKFLHKSVVKTTSLSAAKPAVTTVGGDFKYGISKEPLLITTADNNSKSLTIDTASSFESPTAVSYHRPGGTAILVASLMLSFAFLTFAMALLLARRRKRGCMPFGVKRLRHAWDFPSKTDAFKLRGLLLDHSKRNGFEKLDQNASDEENELTNSGSILPNVQFAY